jgi:hypothetical protein
MSMPATIFSMGCVVLNFWLWTPCGQFHIDSKVVHPSQGSWTTDLFNLVAFCLLQFPPTTTSPQEYKRTIDLGLQMLINFSGTGSSIE